MIIIWPVHVPKPNVCSDDPSTEAIGEPCTQDRSATPNKHVCVFFFLFVETLSPYRLLCEGRLRALISRGPDGRLSVSAANRKECARERERYRGIA